ncbi:MAG: hypothetical protein AAF447_03580 [Myxococcota bacterium]
MPAPMPPGPMPDGQPGPRPPEGLDDATLAEEIRALRHASTRRKRLIALAVAGHLVVLVVVVVLPYLRARQRCLEARHRYAAFAACLVNGEPEAAPGLGLPEGALRGYVDVVRRAGLEACLPALDAVAPEPLFWMLPATRHAERQVRRATDKVREEMAQASGGRLAEAPPQPVPERPWLAVQRLIAALTLWAQEADASLNLEAPAVTLRTPRSVVPPERVPVRDRAGSRVTLQVDAERLTVTALDPRGVSWVQVGGGGVDARRLRRPRTLAAVVPGATPTLLWRTDDARCGPSRCVGRAFGLATLGPEDVVTPPPRWFAAHPERVAAVDLAATGVQVVARHAEGELELRRFARAPGPGTRGMETRGTETRGAGTGGAGTPSPAAPLQRRALGPGRQAAFVRGKPVWLSEAGLHMGPEASLVAPGRFARLEACGAWLVVSGPETRQVRWGSTRLDLPPEGRVELLDCAGDALLLGRRDGDDSTVHRCGRQGCESVELPGHRVRGALLRGASGEAAAAPAPALLASWTRTGGAIALARWDETLGPWQRPAACLSESGGFCGPARVAAGPGRVVAAGRQRDDLLVIESVDGRAWRPLRGLRRGP